MTLSQYGRLEDSDVMQEGDEIRYDSPYSNFDAYADESLDESRRQWQRIYPYWVGKTFGEFRNGPSQRGRGKIDCRRRLPNKEG